MPDTQCPFCAVQPDHVLVADGVAIAFADTHTTAEGYTLIAPRKHVGSIYELTGAEQTAVWQFVGHVREILADRCALDAFNIGVNHGLAAEQNAPHALIHVAPRLGGGVPEQQGGIRWIVARERRTELK
jgi:diadenosine tetraphosphate (Ap4A) HIT family hydrolase